MIVLGYVYRHATIKTVLPIVASSVAIDGVTCNDMGKTFQDLMDQMEADGKRWYDFPFSMVIAEGFVGAGEKLDFANGFDLKEHEFYHDDTGVVLTSCGICAWGMCVAKGDKYHPTNVEICEEELKDYKDCAANLAAKGYWTPTRLTFHTDCCS